ncbi:hypothetical protein WKI71_21020 [Streptomyces sp. MS1.AVA.1]|uniref:Uncharacterized protein n=1 Tax=Streptomyces machairae TaxID=3134109 RepID=A0ABU8UM56_9ACTN
MTTVTIETSTTATPSRGPRGLVWTMLRLHRSALWFWVMLVAVAAGALLWAYGPGRTPSGPRSGRWAAPRRKRAWAATSRTPPLCGTTRSSASAPDCSPSRRS